MYADSKLLLLLLLLLLRNDEENDEEGSDRPIELWLLYVYAPLEKIVLSMSRV